MIRHLTRFISMPFAHELYVLSLVCAAEPCGLSTISNPPLSSLSRAHHTDIAQ